jgi:hypothetical protein
VFSGALVAVAFIQCFKIQTSRYVSTVQNFFSNYEGKESALLIFFVDLKSASTASIAINSGPPVNPLQCESEELIAGAYVWHFNAN